MVASRLFNPFDGRRHSPAARSDARRPRPARAAATLAAVVLPLGGCAVLHDVGVGDHQPVGVDEVLAIEPDGPASDADIEEGDDTVMLMISRNGDTVETEVTLANRPTKD